MLLIFRKTDSFRRSRHSRRAIPGGSSPSHLLHDLGFDAGQVDTILAYIADARDPGRRSPGFDAELSYCVRVPANANERGESNASTPPGFT